MRSHDLCARVLLDLSSYSNCFLWDKQCRFGPTFFVDSDINENVLQSPNLPLKSQTHCEYSVFWVIAFNLHHSLHLLFTGVAFWSGRRNFTHCGWKPPYFPSDNECCAVRWSNYLQEHHQSFLLPRFHCHPPPIHTHTQPHFASLRLFTSSNHLLSSFSTEHSKFSSAYVVIHGAQLEPREGCIIAAFLSGICSCALVSSQHCRLLFPVSSLILQLTHNRNKVKQRCVALFADIFQNCSAGE